MRFTTKTEYGLVCLINIAKHTLVSPEPVPIKDLVKDEGFSLAYTEKILQTLRAAKIVGSHQGHNGGYVLARPAGEITLKEVVEALEGATFDVFCEPETRSEITCTHFPACSIKPLWEKTKSLLDDFFGSITLESLIKNPFAAVAARRDPSALSEKAGGKHGS